MRARVHLDARRSGLVLTSAVALAVVLFLGGTSPVEADALFVDRASEVGIDFQYWNGASGEFYFPEIAGGGVALCDYDGDGDLDVFLPQGRMLDDDPAAEALAPPPLPAGDRLYRNELVPTGRLHFSDVTAAAGLGKEPIYAMGATCGDVDSDGDLDLYVTAFGPNRLWINRGDGTFADGTEHAGLGDPGWSVPAVFFDYDRDGHLDLFVGNYVEFTLDAHKECRGLTGRLDYCGPLAYPAATDRLYRNLGDGTFTDVTSSAGLGETPGTALGAVALDADDDGWMDLYVANDAMPNRLWMSSGDGRFRDEALLAGVAVNSLGRPEAGMGVAAGDYDGDGDRDLLVTHLARETNTLYRNLGRGLFEDATLESGLGGPSWSHTGFGTAWLDADADGKLDLLVVNGRVHTREEALTTEGAFPFDEPDLLFLNLGRGRFQEATARGGAALALSRTSRGLAVGDLDNDGDLDAVVVDVLAPARVLIATADPEHWLGLRLVQGERAGDALGARATLLDRGDGTSQTRWVARDGSYASASDPRVLFTLAGASDVARLTVRWPDGNAESFSVPLGRYTTLRRGDGSPIKNENPP